MAQHIPIDQFDHPTIMRIARGVRATRYFPGSLRYEEVTIYAHHETPDDRVFIRHVNVPVSLVFGGKATIEVHTRLATPYLRVPTNIYLVA